jgi:hypothetical protein
VVQPLSTGLADRGGLRPRRIGAGDFLVVAGHILIAVTHRDALSLDLPRLVSGSWA